MPAPVVAVLNMKGGVGKTTVATHVPKEIYISKRVSVLLLDLDPQYNMTQQLVTPTRYESLAQSKQSVLRLFEPTPANDFFDVNTTSDEPPSPLSISYRLRHLTNAPEKNISIIPGTFELTKYSFITENQKLTHARNYFKRAISKARNEFDLIVIDMNPSSSFLTFCGLAVATDVVSPVRPDKFSLLGLDLVRRLIEHPSVDPKPNWHVLMNCIGRSNGMTDIEREVRLAPYYQTKLLNNRLYFSGVLEARSDYTGFASDKKVKNKNLIARDLRNVGLELCGRIGL
jgi:chromosome partitioning protein